MDPLVRRIEECSLNALPALRSLLLDGWLLRFADGYTRRANSVNPVYGGNGDAEARIAACETLYGAAGLSCIFRLTPLAQPADLEVRLADRGYRREAPTAVQVLTDPARHAEPHPDVAVTLVEPGPRARPPRAWVDALLQLGGAPPAYREALTRLLGRVALPVAYALRHAEGRPVACGLGVQQLDTLGVFDMVTDPAERRRGHARAVLEALLHHAVGRGVRTVYLQVMEDNAPALQLYAGLGFRHLYAYTYRVGDAPPPG